MSAAPAALAVATAVVDVEAVLEEMAAKNPQKLNWRTSIVDRMKLVGMVLRKLAENGGKVPADLLD